jgi:hypothetical protein
MDLMRMPLGILTGIGFIGGGQLGLGVAGTILTILTLRVVNWVDVRMPREQHAVVAIAAAPNSSSLQGLSDLLAPLGFKVRFRRQAGAEGFKDPPSREAMVRDLMEAARRCLFIAPSAQHSQWALSGAFARTDH